LLLLLFLLLLQLEGGFDMVAVGGIFTHAKGAHKQKHANNANKPPKVTTAPIEKSAKKMRAMMSRSQKKFQAFLAATSTAASPGA
jgi:hypothetical protein